MAVEKEDNDNKSLLSNLVKTAETFAKEQLSGRDGSHDFFHAHRVRNTALLLYSMSKNATAATNEEQEGQAVKQQERPSKKLKIDDENYDESAITIEIACLMHDVYDHKYISADEDEEELLKSWLVKENCPEVIAEKILAIVINMGFKASLASSNTTTTTNNEKQKGKLPMELQFVQDADRLDAIGAIGIARCLTFGGARNSVLYDPEIEPKINMTKEEYSKSTAKSTTINHFYEKLLLLKDKMLTKEGRIIAEGRHKKMELFLKDFYAEWNGQA